MANENLPIAHDPDDEAYDSAEDEDFQLDAAPDDSDLSSDADEVAEPAKKKRKTDTHAKIPEGDDLDSGDEATIRKARERKAKRRKGKKPKGKHARDSDEDDMDVDDDEGGTGGFVRTRAMKQHMSVSLLNSLLNTTQSCIQFACYQVLICMPRTDKKNSANRLPKSTAQPWTWTLYGSR